jgi:zinc protease
MSSKRFLLPLFLLTFFAAQSYGADAPQQKDITRATLDNGMRVVIIHNSLAPVVTVQANVIVGGDETPEGFPGMAHALEHMAFRGCAGMSADQTSAIYAQMGGDNNADTQQNITQYYATVPAADLDVALQAQVACMRGVDNSDAEWNQERGAIEQEVARDLSNPTYKFISRLNEDMLAGTPYAHDALGTKASFDATTGAQLKEFYGKWYTPANSILVIVGDVDAAATLAKVKQLYANIPSHPLPKRTPVELKPVKTESFTLDSNLPYVLAFIAYRFPGTESPDYAAAQVLSDVLASQRGDIYAMVPAGKALAAEFGMGETYPKASVAFGLVALPSGKEIAEATGELRKIIANYADKGVPEELVTAAIRSEVAQAEFQRNSIPGLANVWSTALAAEGRNSPDEEVDAIKRVTLADVNRVAKQYLVEGNSITAILKPVPNGEPVAEKGFGGGEKLTNPPTKPVELPSWAAGTLAALKVPTDYLKVSDSTLPNGIRLIVKSDTTSPTISVIGAIKHNPDMQTPPGQEGVSDLLGGLFSYGTKSLDRIAFQKALDDIAANESAGFGFSLNVLKENFSRGVQLLADNELHPALPEQAFQVVQQQTTQFVAGNLDSPGYKTSRALDLALLPKGDPALREVLPATVGKVTLDQVKQYMVSTFRPDLTTIVVIGDVTPEMAKEVIEKWFGEWKAAGPKPETTLPAIPVNKASTTSVPDSEAIQDSVILAERLTLNRFDPDYYPLQLANHVLGGGFYATRLYHDLRQTTGYVYNVNVDLEASKTRSTYTVSYGCNPENVSKARALVERDLEQMRTEDVTSGELHQAKALMLRQIPLSESSEDAVAGGLLSRAEMGLPLDEPIHAAKRYFDMTAADIKAAFARQIRTGDLVQVVRGPAPK